MDKVLLRQERLKVKVGQIPTGKGENRMLVDDYEEFTTLTPFAYTMEYVRRVLRDAVMRVSGSSDKVELNLERWPQVNTALGELYALDRNFRWIRSSDSDNTLLVIQGIPHSN
ncbi:MAG: hypothetical protein MN733_13555 [Nitrososphaera sp.]|nr:hypothetical protein [Nitrososphaera sp.]